MRHYLFRAAIAAAIGSAILAAPAQARVLPDHQRIVRDHRRIVALQKQVHTLQDKLAGAGTVLKHAWPSLTLDEKAALVAVLKTLPKGTKFDIVCNTASCDDLAEDIDDALEAAGFESGLDHASGPLGYGVGVLVNEADKARAERAIAALERATGGRLAPELMIAKPGQNPAGFVSIVIGKYRAPAR